MRVGGADDDRPESAHLFLEKAYRVVQLIAAKGIGANQLRQAIRLVHGCRAYRPHLVQNDADTERGRLPRGFRSREAAADDMDHAASGCFNQASVA
jgi:hypothetical protein